MKAFMIAVLTVAVSAVFVPAAHAVLLAHYKLDESGTTTSTPNSAAAAPAGTDGTATDAGGPFDFDADSGWRPGKAGNAFEFDGTDDLIDTGNDGYDVNSIGTISAWINTADFSRNVIFASASDSDVNNWLRFGVRDNDSKNRISIGGQFPTSNELMSDTTNLLPNTWYHVAATSDGSTWRLFVNGVEESTLVLGGTNAGNWFSYTDSGTDTNSYAIGSLRRSSGDTDFYNGLIDDVQIYSTPLSSYELGLLTRFPGLNLQQAKDAAIPEPGTGLLLGLGVLGCLIQRRRRRGK